MARSARNCASGFKKNEIKPWQKKEWCIPPEANAEFVCNMEDVLEVYKRPMDPAHPVVCMDESSKQNVAEICEPIPAEPSKTERDDYEYERNGVSNLFIFFDPLAGWLAPCRCHCSTNRN